MNETEWVTGNVTLSVGGSPLKMQMTVPANPVKPHRMLPIFQQMAGSFIGMAVDSAAANGQQVSCAAGCGACCRQMVPLAEIETYHLAEIVEKMEPDRREVIKSRFADALQRVAASGIFERMTNIGTLSSAEREALVVEYFRLGIACPLLENESCSIHEDRPIACREYLVSSPPINCSTLGTDVLEPIEVPIVVSKSLRKLGQERSISGVDFIPLVLALEWVERNPDRFSSKTGEQWMAEFFGILTAGSVSG